MQRLALGFAAMMLVACGGPGDEFHFDGEHAFTADSGIGGESVYDGGSPVGLGATLGHAIISDGAWVCAEHGEETITGDANDIDLFLFAPSGQLPVGSYPIGLAMGLREDGGLSATVTARLDHWHHVLFGASGTVRVDISDATQIAGRISANLIASPDAGAAGTLNQDFSVTLCQW